MLAGDLLIYFKENMRVVYLEETKNDSNKDVKYCIESDLTVYVQWKFATKTQNGGTKAVRKM